MNKNNNEIQNYFTTEVTSRVREMSNEDMKTLLKDLESTPYWIAILKYNQDRISVIQNSFLTLDPVKNPTEISRYQGAITGILDLQDAVLSLKFENRKKESPKYKEDQAKDEMGGAYGTY